MAKPTVSEENRPCAALTREGAPCRNPAASGQPLCRLHASARPASVRADEASLYEEGIAEEERHLWERISVTDLDAEIRIAKLQLKRLLAAQKRAELAEAKPSDETPSKRKTGKRMSPNARAIDYDDRVNRLLGRISDLVVTRAKLQREADAKQKERAADPADDPVERLARRIDRVAARIGAKPAGGDSGGR